LYKAPKGSPLLTSDEKQFLRKWKIKTRSSLALIARVLVPLHVPDPRQYPCYEEVPAGDIVMLWASASVLIRCPSGTSDLALL